jgi:hypothetical protein
MSIHDGSSFTEVMVTGTLPTGDDAAPVTYLILDMDRNAIVGQVGLPSALSKPTPVSMAVKVPNATARLAIGTFDAGGKFQACSFLNVGAPARPAGAMGPAR